MKFRTIPASLPITFVVLLGACASDSDRYPSLDVRPAERVHGIFAPVDPAPPTLVPAEATPELLASLTQIQSAATAAHQDFLKAAPGARKAANSAINADVASNAWGDAQIALSGLDSARSRVAISLGDLDLLFANATLGFEERHQINHARNAVIAMLQEEDSVLAELRALVR